VNLFLHVGDRRPDGYHELQSLVAFTRAGDELSFAPGQEFKLDIQGPFADALTSDSDNLVLKAARALAEHAGVRDGAHIVLTKNLPVASGIGGGSADAAATLRGLAQLWNLGLPHDVLRRIGETLGSDIPVCVECKSAWMEGRGERVAVLNGIPAAAMVLVNPGVAVPTGRVFAALKERCGVGLPRPPKMQNAVELVAYLKTTANDLEAPAREIAPVIGDVLDALASRTGALLSRMSGSGATCFALFESDEFATAATRALNARNRGWWIMSSRIG